MTVCIISNVDDPHAICVEQALIRKGVQVVNWHWGDFPGVSRLSIEFSASGTIKVPILEGPLKETSLWVHRGLRAIAPASLHPADVAFVHNESHVMLNGMLAKFSRESFCVNPRESVRKLESKINQLELATTCGFIVPPSLFSNDPGAIRRFFAQYNGNIVVKHSSQMRWESPKDRRVHLTFTSRINADHIANDEQLSACPSIFQKEIAKAFELRIVFIGNNIFAIKIDSQKSKESVDWRQDFKGYPPCSTYELPLSELKKIKKFIHASGLRYGSIDVIVDRDGIFHFLEVNETGQFLWIEDILPEVLLLDCFAEFLARRDPDFEYRPDRNIVRCGDFDSDISPDALNMRRMGHVERKNSSTIIEQSSLG
jgi:glutathione synthase/RimK-type ligase-like ATP-grasp enzyme